MTRFGFCNILDNQDLRKCYRLRPLALLIILTSTLIFPDITQTSSITAYSIRRAYHPPLDVSHPNYSSHQA